MKLTKIEAAQQTLWQISYVDESKISCNCYREHFQDALNIFWDAMRQTGQFYDIAVRAGEHEIVIKDEYDAIQATLRFS